jgi:tetratricopeptide (TPR) repeat protein
MFSNHSLQNPKDADGYFVRGTQRLQKGDYKGAIADFSTSVDLYSMNPDPDCPGVYMNRAQAYEFIGEIEKANADYTTVIKGGIVPHIYSGYLFRGVNLSNQEYKDLAINDFSFVIQYAPGDIGWFESDTEYDSVRYQAYMNRGIAYMQKKQSTAAINDFLSAGKIEPQNIEVYIGLGQVYLQLHNIAEAITALNRAEKIDPRDARVYGMRYQAKLAIDDIAGVISDCRKYLDVGGGQRFGNSDEIETLLNQLLTDKKGAKQSINQEKTTKTKLAAAKLLIQEKQYHAAKEVLRTIDHPLAFKWLYQLNQLLDNGKN